MENIWPLTGRAEELELLESLCGSDRRGVVLCGPAGVGKTRLATELSERARARGFVVERVTASRSMSGIAFGALIHLIPVAADATDGTVELMQGLRDALSHGDRPVLLLVDDGHLLDDASATVIHMLAATGAAFVVVTVRAREPVPEALTTLWKDGLAARLELQPLSRTETAEMLAAGLNGQVSRLTANRLWHATRGNVLFLRELVRAGRECGRLALRGEVWSWDGDIAFGERLSELIEARLVGLTAAERAVLEVLAVGEPLELAFLPHKELSSLEERGLVAATAHDGRVTLRLAHPLYGESLRARLGTLRRRAILAGLAEKLAGTGTRRRGDLIRLAGWSLDGGRPLDPATMLAAAHEARHVFDHRTTERFARNAAENGGGPDAHLLVADALYWQCRHDEAARVLDLVPDDVPNPWRAIVSASNLFWGLGETDAAEKELLAAQERVGPSAEHDEYAAHRASIVMFNGRAHEARAVAEAVLTSPNATDLGRARALQALIPALALIGRTDRAIEIAEAGISFARNATADVPWSVNYLQAGQATALWLAGRLTEMHALAQEGYTAATSRRTDDVRGLWATLLGRALLAKGQVASARRQFAEAADLLRQHDFGSLLSWCHASHAMAAAWLGDLDAASSLLEAARQAKQPMVRTHDSEILLAEAWIAAMSGERSRAERLVRSAADTAAARGHRALEALALHDGIRLGVPGLRHRLTTLAEQVDGEMTRCFAAHATETDLLAVSKRFEALGATLLAAETAAQAGTFSRARALASRCEGARTPILRTLDESPVVAAMTSREREIAELAARGLSNQEISDRLTLSIRTVGNHLTRLYGKLGLRRDDLPGLFDLD
ncbi:LuxR C-terminal-related transcriptional regulator [Lentzea alba]|uniref:helix-turn-helix transcriptional regulator n=1 Tax=Lentzea alba TaxID=2714351 RepID=UPI0039BEFD81